MADYLSREEILRAFGNLTVKNPDDKYQHGMQDAIDCLIPEVINGMEVADVQPVKRGRWVTVRVDGDSETICNNCYENTIMRTDFCPHCGADMRGADATKG